MLPEYYLRSWQRSEGATYKQYQARNLPVSEIFEITGGNSGLTEEYLYSLLFHAGDRRYRLLTGSIDAVNTDLIPLLPHPKNADKTISVISGEGIHIVRKGKAGHINYLPAGDYTMTDDAYVLTNKPGGKYKVSLKWVVETQAAIFREYASKSDNGTWNKNGFFKHATIDIPSLGYPFNRSKLRGWVTLVLARTIRSPWASSRPGSGPMRTA